MTHERAGRTAFTLALSMFVVLIIFLSTQLGPVARVVPLSVALPTLALLAAQLLLDIYPSLARTWMRFAVKDFLAVEADAAPSPADETAVPPAAREHRDQLRFMFWVGAFPLTVLLLGFTIASPLYTLLYLKVQSGEKWLLALAMAAVMLALVYFAFGQVLNAPLYRGWLWDGLR